MNNSDDIIDSREVIERIVELTAERDETLDDTNAVDWETEFPNEAAELKALESLQEEAKGYSPDWEYGSTLIRDSYFIKYTQELLQDIGDLPKDIPAYIAIDWEETARNIQQDYTSVEFDGVTYWVR